MKLIWNHHWCDPEVASGYTVYPFEYKSKEDFVFDILEEFKKNKEVHYPHVKVFDSILYEEHLEFLESEVYILEEYFERFKEHVVIL